MRESVDTCYMDALILVVGKGNSLNYSFLNKFEFWIIELAYNLT